MFAMTDRELGLLSEADTHKNLYKKGLRANLNPFLFEE
jgi:hypothetical protein